MYTIREHPTVSSAGRWHLVSVRCNGSPEPTTKSFQVTIHAAEAMVCTFANAFVPSGSISIAKITQGATGTANFLVSSRTAPPAQYRQRATTTASGVAANAKPVAVADATGHLPLGAYAITEELPPSALANGWTLTSVVCNGVLERFAQGTVKITPTPAQHTVHCVYTDAFSSAPPPPPPPPVIAPAPGSHSDLGAVALSDLVVTKTASPTVVTRGRAVSYRITVRNLGPDAAQRVVPGDRPRGPATVISVHNPAGACQTSLPIVCRLGTIKPGATVTITVQLAVDTSAPNLTNRAVAGTATSERTLTNNVSQATVKVIAPRPAAPPPGLG